MKKNILFIFLVVSYYCIIRTVSAEESMLYKYQFTPTPTFTQEQVFSLFKTVAFIGNLNLTVPTIIETSITNINEQSIAIREVETNTRQPLAFISKTSSTPYTITVKSSGFNTMALHDGNESTFLEFPLLNSNAISNSEVSLLFHYVSPIDTSQLQFTLDKNVYLPDSVEVFVYRNGQRITVLSKQKISSTTLQFPQYSATELEVVFHYSQPLRISEIAFIETQPSYTSRYLRFLARPGYSYQIYKDADGMVPYQYLPEAGNLYEENINIKTLGNIIFSTNPSYIPADQDRDGIFDSQDNCITIANKDQSDINNNSRGDACEDFDLDGVINATDNCPDKPNSLQQDKDSDGKGDHCDDEESRLVEQWKFLPWIGIAVGFGVVILLFKLTLHHEDKEDQMVGTSNESKNFQKK